MNTKESLGLAKSVSRRILLAISIGVLATSPYVWPFLFYWDGVARDTTGGVMAIRWCMVSIPIASAFAMLLLVTPRDYWPLYLLLGGLLFSLLVYNVFESKSFRYFAYIHAIGRNPRSSPMSLRSIYAVRNRRDLLPEVRSNIRRLLVVNRNTPPDILREIAMLENPVYDDAIILNPNTPPDLEVTLRHRHGYRIPNRNLNDP
ncbi:hypothetical protein Pan216_42710 [Planctomycetes bacterium Pan216]|uniref:Uncharacterized protein n=1 Tax=Kolteria novifilia TaxID=2527975 RepID=A0A518B8W0_9BACT|nr:hypothetical protein Pan216_42710 [Planctomycetes bacterium Pan216]